MGQCWTKVEWEWLDGYVGLYSDSGDVWSSAVVAMGLLVLACP